MYTSNAKVVTKLPNLISTIGDIPEEVKTTYTPYGNKYTVFNFGYHFSNPLILPIDVTVDFITYGNITLSSNVVKSNTFTIVTEYGNKFAITGEGTVLVWYRYGKLDPASFNLIMQYALQKNDYVLVDALLHTLSIQEAISYVLQNPEIQEVLLKGLDWQLNKIGFKDFLAYLNGGKYDVRHLALFLTIASYVFPCVFEYSSVPQFTGEPLEVYIRYLLYLSEFGQVVTTDLSDLSEQSAYHQSEIEELFSQSAYHESQIITLSSEVSELFVQSSLHESEIISLSESVDELETQVLILYAEDLIINSEIHELSEEIVSEQSEITALSEFTSECCNNVLIQLGKVLTDLLRITGVVYQLVNAVGSEYGLNVSELDGILSETVGDITCSLKALLGLANYLLPNSCLVNTLSNDLSETLSEVGGLLGGVGNLLGGLLGGVGNLLGGLLGNLASVTVKGSEQSKSGSESFGFHFHL